MARANAEKEARSKGVIEKVDKYGWVFQGILIGIVMMSCFTLVGRIIVDGGTSKMTMADIYISFGVLSFLIVSYIIESKIEKMEAKKNMLRFKTQAVQKRKFYFIGVLLIASMTQIIFVISYLGGLPVETALDAIRNLLHIIMLFCVSFAVLLYAVVSFVAKMYKLKNLQENK